MKTTLNISDVTMRAVRKEAARRGQTITELVELALRAALVKPVRTVEPLPELPAFNGGGPRVNVANREELFSRR